MAQADPDAGGAAPEPLAYSVVANVAAETAQGVGGLDVRAGIRHFAAGAKVWVLPVQWGDGGEHVAVAGRHRGSAGPYIRMVVPRRHLTSYRVKAIHSPALMRALTRPWKHHDSGPRLWQDRDEAQAAVRDWQQPRIKAQFDDVSFSDEVDDPPPMELYRDGKTYHLAHFNALRALYSVRPPPVEPGRRR